MWHANSIAACSAAVDLLVMSAISFVSAPSLMISEPDVLTYFQALHRACALLCGTRTNRLFVTA